MIIVIVEGSTSQSIQSCRLRLFYDSVVEASSLLVGNSRSELVVNNTFNLLPQSNNTRISSSLLVDTTTLNVDVNDTFKLWQHEPSSNIDIVDKKIVPTLSNTSPTIPLILYLNIWHDLFKGQHLWQKINTCKIFYRFNTIFLSIMYKFQKTITYKILHS